MSEKSQEILMKTVDEPYYNDGNIDEIDKRTDKAFYESSKVDIRDNIGKEDFMYVWLTSKEDIQYKSVTEQAIFVEQILDKIEEVYDFTFSEKITFENKYEIQNFYKFLEFLEFNNTAFISFVWQILNPKDFFNMDIKKYCNDNSDKILKEVEEQIQVHPQPELITKFLRGFYREGFIEWFAKHTIRKKVEIQIKIIS